MARANLTNAYRAVLLEDLAIIDMVDERIRPDALMQGEVMPAIRYRTLEDRRLSGVGGPSSLRTNRTQFDCHASTREEADELGGLVEDALNNLSGVVHGVFIDDCLVDNNYATDNGRPPGSDDLEYIRVVDFNASYQADAVTT